ncbi:MAG: DUF3179 domain-containing protein [Planctomycetaceae bacterium]|jgi:hypothetical protein|nr:DUF3179 domain-containing protein [Planctomycetaceae bacterium]
MNTTDDQIPAAPQGSPTLTFRGGGWIIALAGLLVALLLGWSLLGPMLGRRPIGDGRTLESYGFDLSNLLIPRETLVPSGNPRGFLPSLDGPQHLRGAEMRVYNENNRPKYVVSLDRVAGIVINGQAHAWPLSMMNVHEVVNDTVGGVPVAATYSPLCDSVVVFDRRVGGVERQFEVSGLLVDSNLVFYDKAPAGTDTASHTPSLFVQLEFRAVSGPMAAAGSTIEPLPGVCITTWQDWLATHPETTVTLRDAGMVRRMKEISYARYFLSPRLEFPADPAPDAATMESRGLRLKSPMVAAKIGDGWVIVPIEREDRDSQAPWATSIDGVALTLTVPEGPAVSRLARQDGQPLATVPLLYFASEALLAPRHDTQLAP